MVLLVNVDDPMLEYFVIDISVVIIIYIIVDVNVVVAGVVIEVFYPGVLASFNCSFPVFCLSGGIPL